MGLNSDIPDRPGLFALEAPGDTPLLLPATLAGPRGLLPPPEAGIRVRHSPVVTHTHDRRSPQMRYTISGGLLCRTFEELEADLDTLEELLPRVVRVWRRTRYLSVTGGWLVPIEPKAGMRQADIAMVFDLTRAEWQRGE